MGLLQGTLTLRRFLALGPVPDAEDLCSGLEQGRYRPFEDGMEEERYGWADWRNPLTTPPDPNYIFQDRFAVFALRIDTRKVPPSSHRSAYTEPPERKRLGFCWQRGSYLLTG